MNRVVQDISNFIFLEDQLEKADIIIIPGGSYSELPERAAEIWSGGYAPLVLATGGFSVKIGKFNGVKSNKSLYNKDYRTEAEFYKDVLVKKGVKEQSIIIEDASGFTRENVLFSKQLLGERNILVEKAIICCKDFHARRCLMYFQLIMPNTQFIVIGNSLTVDGQLMTKNNWYKTEKGQKRVFGELERIGNQFDLDFKQYLGFK